MPAKSATVAPSAATVNVRPLPPLAEPRAPPASNVAFIPVDFQVPTTHGFATPAAEASADALAEGPVDALGAADPVSDPFDVHAARPRVSPAATAAILMTRIGTPPYANTWS
jgi:hypothetical protein